MDEKCLEVDKRQVRCQKNVSRLTTVHIWRSLFFQALSRSR